MASQSKHGSVFSSVDDGGSVNWVSPENAGASDDTYSVASSTPFASDELTDFLFASNFGFSIPSGATIDGIVVAVECKQLVADYLEWVIKIVKGGSPQGDNKATFSALPTSDAYRSYGGISDKWGLAWSVSDINASNFGFYFQLINTLGSGEVAHVDDIIITVYYTPASTNRGQTMSLMGVG